MNDEQFKEVHQLRGEVQRLRLRLDEVSRRLEQLSRPTAPPPLTTEPPLLASAPPPLTEPEQAAAIVEPPVTSPPVAEAELPPVLSPPPQESFEVRLGTYWLPRIGIAALLTGMVFFAAWVTPRLGIAQKVAVGYLAAIALGVLGMALEKRMPQFARVLLAGSLALAYFVTYAAHFVPGFRVVHSPTVAITMLSVVVLFIIGVAQERQSPALGGMALFFGYYTSVVSGVATFTLASNAVLALAALFFLARNRWVTISYGAVLATYLTYMIWVWKLNEWNNLDHLLFDSGYLTAPEFHLRASFLSLYWLLFILGGLLIRADAMAPAERNGLFTLNNAFFFVLFSLLMHHTYPRAQWQFQFLFAAALLIGSAISCHRYAPERTSFDTLFLQGIGVATLGILSYFKGVQLVAVLALESAFLLVLSRWMKSRWVAWIARAAFSIAGVYAWTKYGNWDNAMLWGVTFTAAVGYVSARLERAAHTDDVMESIHFASLYYAAWATLLLMGVAHEHFEASTLPWVWTLGAVAVAMIAWALRTREIFWASQIPLAWAHTMFYGAKLDDHPWGGGPSLALVLVTFGFGLFLWRRYRRTDDRPGATSALWPYSLLAVAAALLATWDHCPDRWQLTAYSVETLALIIAGSLATESVFAWLSLAPMAVGAASYVFGGPELFSPPGAAWTNLVVSLALFAFAERTLARDTAFAELRLTLMVVLTALALSGLYNLVSAAFLTVAWALLGFVLLAIGFALKQRSYRMAGLAALAFSLARAVLHDMARVETVYRILSFIGLGVILLVLAFLYAKNREKIAKWL
ncbi:MAG TPA: DUF2339 domain-containing protein [Verrucomicrobiae bacterium]|nr:DUF2339 domain-containing protein [Verrucomicrobiae bacterium]